MDPSTNDAPSERSPEFVQSLERGFAVIKAFGPGHDQLTLTEVAVASGLSRAAARRFLITLVDLGYVQTGRRLFSLRPKVLELGYSYLSSLSLTEIAPPLMEALVARVGLTCSICVLDGDETTYVSRVVTNRIMAVAVSVGTRFPAYVTSMGRVLLAGQPDDWIEDYLRRTTFHSYTDRTVIEGNELHKILETVRAQGYSILDQELETGVRSIAVPIRNSSGTVVAAMNIATATSQVTAERLRTEILRELKRTAQSIEEGLRAAT